MEGRFEAGHGDRLRSAEELRRLATCRLRGTKEEGASGPTCRRVKEER